MVLPFSLTSVTGTPFENCKILDIVDYDGSFHMDEIIVSEETPMLSGHPYLIYANETVASPLEFNNVVIEKVSNDECQPVIIDTEDYTLIIQGVLFKKYVPKEEFLVEDGYSENLILVFMTNGRTGQISNPGDLNGTRFYIRRKKK
jgi:hypothetical protein